MATKLKVVKTGINEYDVREGCLTIATFNSKKQAEEFAESGGKNSQTKFNGRLF